MKWLKTSDYFNSAKLFISLFLFEYLLFTLFSISINLLANILFLILNCCLLYIYLYMANEKYINRMKREAKIKNFIDKEYEKINDENNNNL